MGLFVLLTCLSASPAQAEFGLNNFDVEHTDADGQLAPAGSHPFALTASFGTNTRDEGGIPVVEGQLRDLLLHQVPGLVADTTAYKTCTTLQFLQDECPLDTAVGVSGNSLSEVGLWKVSPLYNVAPPPGVLARFGFTIDTTRILVDAGLTTSPPYIPFAVSRNTAQMVSVYANKTQVWGEPADPAHDHLRGPCGSYIVELGELDIPGFDFEGKGDLCPLAEPRNPRPLLTMPTTCEEPLPSRFEALSWAGDRDAGSVLTHGPSGSPEALGGCELLGLSAELSAQPTNRAASGPTGLDFELHVDDPGLTATGPERRAHSHIRETVVTLPEGMTANPSLAEGLAVCSEADLARETLASQPGEGCPQASKIGTVEVESPLLDEAIHGALYIAEPYANPFGSLLALYIVIKNPNLGLIVKQPAKVTPNPVTGQLVTTTEDMPQLPFSHFRLHFREGARSPLVTPPACGSHTVTALLYPWSGGEPVESTSTFEIITGPNEGPCPTGGLPPFHPGLIAGTLNNAAGHYSPFNVRLFRSDSEQEITHFSIKLPPGVIGKLAGVATCPDAAIAAATARTGPLGGHEELAAPSCPASSYVGRTLVGSGVGPSLAYAPGNVYLAGPYHGAPISIVAITAGVVGPFDIGTVVVREALRIDPETAEVFIDATGSDPIPHIVQGIPVHLRDIRVYTDRPEFVLNPTGCEPTSTASTVLGSGLDFVSPADDNPVVVSTRFQAADCAALPFKPKLTFKLKGSTKRGGNPSLRAHVAMNGIGEAAIRFAQVSLPRSEFLDNAHIGTICTRTQFRTGTVPGENCPAASIYGHVSALTPILDGPLTGPIYLRSSEHELPDLVAALHHAEINIALVGRVDSVKGGGIRNTFEFVPDAPVTSADFTFFGAAKGLLQNSTNLCRSTNKVKVLLKAHSGKRVEYKTPLKPSGCKGKKRSKRHAR